MKYQVTFGVVQHGRCTIEVDSDSREEVEMLAMERYEDEVTLDDISFQTSDVFIADVEEDNA